MRETKPHDKPTMNRAAIYARFSSDLQNDRSIDDQLALCRAYAEREGLSVVTTFADRAVSGASIHGRPGIQDLMRQARERGFDVVIAETMSRIGRDQEDRAAIRKRLGFLGIRLMTPTDGVVTPLTDGIRAVIDSQYLDDLKGMIRRGLSGCVREGRSGGGLTYGYRVVKKLDAKGEPIRGLREIDPDTAPIVERVFAEYVEGRTPRDIAHDLNRDGVTPPRGRAWNASTINGESSRGSGILNNELYAGRITWNKVRMVKDPDTGRRVSRPNPRSEWQVTDVPHLAIVSRDLFEAAQARRAARGLTLPVYQRRPRHLLSGLLRCGCCGAGMASNGKDKSGRVRVRCSAASESGTCPDPKTFYLAAIESAVLSGLSGEMRHPAVIAEYVRTYHEERKRLAGQRIVARVRLEQRLGEIEREITRVVDAIAKGTGDVEVLGPRTKELNAERKRIAAELAAAPEPPNAIALHPNVLARYEQQIARLQEALAAGVDAGDSDPAEALRDLVESVTVFRDASRSGGVEIEIVGRLNSLLGESAYPNKVRGVWGRMVAEEGLEPPTQGL